MKVDVKYKSHSLIFFRLHFSHDDIFNEISDVPETELILRQKIESLQKQLKKSEREWMAEKTALMQDRSLCLEEGKAQQAKDAAHIKLLSAK